MGRYKNASKRRKNLVRKKRQEYRIRRRQRRKIEAKTDETTIREQFEEKETS